MSLHPDPLHRPTTHAHLPPVPLDADDRLVAIARALHDIAVDDPGPTDLVGIVDLASIGVVPEPGGRPDHLVLTTLDDPDPVASLLGRSSPDAFWAVGLVTGATARPLDGAPGADDATFVHLVDRRGVSVGVLSTQGARARTEGPTPEPARGRAADACRRMLGLPTAPPPPDMTAHVVDLWLARTTRAALDQPGLDWPAVVRHNPAHDLAPGTAVPTPAAIARHTVAFGDQLDWERYRQRCVDAGTTPFGELDGSVARWMDAGMFARWLLGESMPWSGHLDLLEGLLSPGAADRLRAAVALCPTPPWPPAASIRP